MVLLVASLLTFLLIMACAADMRRYEIPHSVTLAILLMFIAWCFISPADVNWLSGIYAAMIFFLCGLLLFATKLMGGGDIKLLTVLALWMGISQSLIAFLFYMSIAGMGLAFILLLARKLAIYLIKNDKKLPELLQKGAPIPYGVAIAVGFIHVLWAGKVASIPL